MATSITATGITETTTLYELLRPLVKPAKRPTAAWLRKNAKPIAEHSQMADSKPHLSMNATLFDNGFGIYSSGGHTTVVWLADCLDIVYRFGFSTSGEREADQTKIDRDVLGNLPWFQAFVLRGEAQITGVLENHLYGSRERKKDSENPENPEDPENEPSENPAKEITGATHIANPEERLIREETCEEVKKILDMLPEDAAEAYMLYHAYGMTECEIADALGLSQPTVSRKIAEAQIALREIVKIMEELLGINLKVEI